MGKIRRVLAPAGRVLLAERLVAGFTDIHCDTRRAGRRTFLILAGTFLG